MLVSLLSSRYLRQMNWIYHPDAPIQGSIVPDEEEQRHLRALRTSEGDAVGCIDGKGNFYECTAQLHKKHTELIVQNTISYPLSHPTLEMAIAPTKNTDRLEWFVEKAVELGIHKISLIKCDHSERPHLKLDRLYRVAISAMKQSRKVYLPLITEVTAFKSWVESAQASIKCIAHCEDDVQKTLVQTVLRKGENTIIAIGPEGDFSPAEIQLAKQLGFLPVSLGEARLRTETAGIAAVHTFQLIHQTV